MSKEENKKLIEKYKWLEPSNRWSGTFITDTSKPFWPGKPDAIPEYDYEYTELDDMPKGWRNAFGLQMCEEIQQALNQFPEDKRNEFRITQIKEKYGSLRFYTNFGSKEIYDIINKYEKISYNTCIQCGKPATFISMGWVSPYCEECARSICEETNTKIEEEFYPIEES